MQRVIADSILRAARPNFLTLTPLCVLIGIGAAAQTGTHVLVMDCVLAMCGALCAHLSVNLLNEYDDFRSGLDALTVRTAFSGGSGSLPAHPEAAAAARAAGLACLGATVLIGAYFLYEKGLAVLPLGLVGIVLVVAYTPKVTHQPLLCLLAPGLGFGPVMVIGTAFVLTGHYSWGALVASLPPLFLVSGLLLLNQFPDIEADRHVGRRHLPIVVGRRRSAMVFGWLVGAAFGALFAAVLLGALPRMALLGLLALPLGVVVAKQVRLQAENLPKLVRYMGLNVAMIHGALLLTAVGLLIG